MRDGDEYVKLYVLSRVLRGDMQSENHNILNHAPPALHTHNDLMTHILQPQSVHSHINFLVFFRLQGPPVLPTHPGPHPDG